MKNSADLGGCYPPRLSASVDNTLLDRQNSSYPAQPHSIIAKNITCPLVDMSFIFSCQEWARPEPVRYRVEHEDKIHIHAWACNIIYLQRDQEWLSPGLPSSSFSSSKRKQTNKQEKTFAIWNYFSIPLRVPNGVLELHFLALLQEYI